MTTPLETLPDAFEDSFLERFRLAFLPRVRGYRRRGRLELEYETTEVLLRWRDRADRYEWLRITFDRRGFPFVVLEVVAGREISFFVRRPSRREGAEVLFALRHKRIADDPVRLLDALDDAMNRLTPLKDPDTRASAIAEIRERWEALEDTA